MKKSKQLREEIAALLAKVEAITAVASEQKRELTEDEQKYIDSVVGKGKAGEADYVAGQVAALEEQLVRAERVEQTQAKYGAQPASQVPGTQAGEPEGEKPVVKPEASRISRIVIPAASAVRHGKLKAYKGEHADKAAYMAGRWLMATLFNRADAQEWCRQHGLFSAAHKESANELGGFVVPEEMEQAVIDLREQYGVFRRESKVVPMSSDTKTVPRRTGGVTAYFGGEGSTMTESEKGWDQVRLTAKKLYALTRYSSELGEDALISIGDDLTNEMAYAFALKEDQCGFIGDATSTYGGMVGVVNAVNAGSIVDALATHDSFEDLTMADFEACVGKLPEYAENNAKWYISKAGYCASMLRLLDAAGGATVAELTGRKQKTFLGYDVVISQVLNSTLGTDASKPKVIFGDLSMGSTLGSRRGMNVMLSDQRYLETDEIGIRGTQRFDINVHEKGTASVPGALIVLKTSA